MVGWRLPTCGGLAPGALPGRLRSATVPPDGDISAEDPRESGVAGSESRREQKQRQIGDAIEMKELPFVLGVLGDFTGQPTTPLPRLRDRKLVEVNPDNFDSVLEGMKPHLAFSVENKLSEDPDAGQLKVDLHFKSLDDFDPENVAKQVKPLRELLDLRTRLADLRGQLQTNDKLEEVLMNAVKDSGKMDKLRKELGGGEGGSNE